MQKELSREEKGKYLSIYKSLEEQFELKKDRFKDIRKLVAIGTGAFSDDDDTASNVDYQQLLDSQHLSYIRTLCSGLYGGLVNPAGQWFETLPSNPDLHNDYECLAYCYDVRKRFEFLFHTSNFYKEFRMTCDEYPVYGFAPLLIEEDHDKIVRFTHFTCGEVYLGCDAKGEYNKMAHPIKLFADQMVDYFGFDNLPKAIQKAYEDGDFNTKFDVYNLICPNYFRHLGSNKNTNFKFISLYWTNDERDQKVFLKKSGYRDNPFAVFTWQKKHDAQIYPLGMGEALLGDIRELQATSYRGSQNEAFLNNPAMVLHSSLGRKPILPGTTFYTDGDPSKMVAELRRVNSYLEEIENKKKSIKERIRELSMADVMMLFASKDKNRMTAREVIAILNEQTNLLGGIYLNAKDSLTRIFERCFAIGLRKGFFAEPPAAMQEDGIKVEFLNQMARAQKAAELGSLQDLFTYATPLFQIKPDAIDNLDGDKAFDMIVKSLAIDTTIQKNPILVQQLRDERAMQQQQMAEAQQMEQMAKTAKQASGATIEPNNLLGALAGEGNNGTLPQVEEVNSGGAF
jgi:hypothetical protein